MIAGEGSGLMKLSPSGPRGPSSSSSASSLTTAACPGRRDGLDFDASRRETGAEMFEGLLSDDGRDGPPVDDCRASACGCEIGGVRVFIEHSSPQGESVSRSKFPNGGDVMAVYYCGGV